MINTILSFIHKYLIFVLVRKLSNVLHILNNHMFDITDHISTIVLHNILLKLRMHPSEWL